MSAELPQQEMTVLLHRAARGEDGARSVLLKAVYDKLHSMAEGRLRGESAGHSLQATVLVHDAYLQLVGEGTSVDFNDRKPLLRLGGQSDASDLGRSRP